MSPWQNQITNILDSSTPSKKTVLIGMGQPLRSDDYVGSYIVKKLVVRMKSELPSGIRVFDGEDNVENLITKVANLRPQHVIFIDACQMRTSPGEARLISVTETDYPFFTTHGVPIKLLAERLLPNSQVWILAIQPKILDFGEKLSDELRIKADSISNFLLELLKRRKDM